ncbi:MAG: hypothetical protein Q9160_007871 [Pyrenula sp. 1 TL-2023]
MGPTSPERSEKGVVPKFSSFKPRGKPEAHGKSDKREGSYRSGPATGEARPSPAPRDRTSHGRTHQWHSEHNRHRQSYQGSHGSADGQSSFDEQRVIPVTGDEIGDFFIDSTGDPDNLRYGTLHRYNVPEYRLFGRANVLGASRIRPDAKSRRALLHTRIDAEPEPILSHKSSKNDDFNTPRDFIDLGISTQKRRKLDNTADSSDDSDRPDQYRLAEGSKATQGTNSRHLASASDPRSKGDDVGLEKRQRMAMLSRLIEESPTDIERWIALIQYQDEMKTPTATKAEIRSLVGIKISIYEKAITKVGDGRDRERLLLGLLEESSKLWESKKLAARWQTILDENPASTALRMKYLDFQQSNFLTFSFEECRTAYFQTFAKLSEQTPSHELDQSYIYIMLRFTSLLLSDGFPELAIALWQSILEFAFFKPEDAKQPNSVERLSLFWESETPRIGEQDAKGWKNSTEGETPDPKTDTPIGALSERDRQLFKTWASREQQRFLTARMPARMMDDVEEDDPFRVILWSDIENLLFEPSTKAGRDLLVNAFCRFCDLPPIDLDGSLVLDWWSDPLLINGPATSAWLAQINDQNRKRNDKSKDDNVQHVYPLAQMFPDAATLFPSQHDHWFNLWTHTYLSDNDSVPLDFKLRTLRLLADDALSSDALVEYVIALPFQVDSKAARKLAKAMLKKRPTSLRLYNAYALVELRSGNTDAAERVWSTALSMSKTFSKEEQGNSIILWRTWIWESLDARQFEKALRLLLAIPRGQIDPNLVNGSEASNQSLTDVLEAQRYLHEHRERAISLHDHHLTLHYTDTLALLAYLTAADRTLDRVLEIYSPISPSPSSNPLSALSAQSLSRVIHLHATTSPIHQPKHTLSLLNSLLAAHPHNTLLLSLSHTHSRHLLLTDRIRSIIPNLSAPHTTQAPNPDPLRTPSLIPTLTPLIHELSRPPSSGSTMHSLHAAFEAAVSSSSPTSSSSSASPFLWTLYLDWSLSLPALAPSKHNANAPIDAKPLLYRALRSAPWACKALIMKALGDERLSGGMAFEEKKALWEVLGEKGVRVLVDAGEVVEGIEEREREGEGD